MKISVVIPAYNEEENITHLYDELSGVLAALQRSYEIIFVDDGSSDNTLAMLRSIQQKDDKVGVIRFRRNFGQTAAMSAGFDFASGDVIVTMDGDLQNDPHDIPRLLEKIEEGYDVVTGWRYDRKDAFLNRRLPSIIANKIISWTTGVALHDYGCTLKAFRREVIKNIRLYGEMHRFIPAIASGMGISFTEIKVNHRPRKIRNLEVRHIQNPPGGARPDYGQISAQLCNPADSDFRAARFHFRQCRFCAGADHDDSAAVLRDTAV